MKDIQSLPLTSTETDILLKLCDGMLYKEIAVERQSAFETVKKHISNIYRKLHVNNRMDACNVYREHQKKYA